MKAEQIETGLASASALFARARAAVKRRCLTLCLLLAVGLILAACAGATTPGAPAGATAPSAQSTTAPAAQSTTAPVMTAAPTTRGSPVPSSPGGSSLPDWWPKALAMPQGAVLAPEVGVPGRSAVWKIGDTNVDGQRDFFVKEASAAGYKLYAVKETLGHTLYLFKDSASFALTVIPGNILGRLVGGIHAKTSGALNAEFDVPVDEYDPPQQGAPFSFNGFIKHAPCDACAYAVTLALESYDGKGTYVSPAASVLDLEATTGGADETYTGGRCSMVVQDELTGTFDCTAMENASDPAKHVDVSGRWHLFRTAATAAAQPAGTPGPAPTPAAAVTNAPTAPVRLKYQVNLTGAFALAGSLEVVSPSQGDTCRAGMGAALAINDQKIGGHKVLFVAKPANVDILFPKPGAYPLDPQNKSGVFIDDAQSFVSGNGSNGTVTLNADGSGQFAFSNFVDERGGTLREGGTITWTCNGPLGQPSPPTSQPPRVMYQLNLTGAVPVSGSLTRPVSASNCSVLGVEAVAGVSGKVGAHSFLLGAVPPDLSGANFKPGTYTLGDSNASVTVDTSTFLFVDGSTGAVTFNADGSGRLTFKDFRDLLNDSTAESGTLSWTCSQ